MRKMKLATVIIILLSFELNIINLLLARRLKCQPLKIPYGSVNYNRRGIIAKVECNNLYQFSGDSYIYCANGNWIPAKLPKCVSNNCPPIKLSPPLYAFPMFRKSIYQLYCNTGYRLHGTNEINCFGNKWDSPLPSCLFENATAPPNYCSFDKDMCGWNHDLMHDFNWERRQYYFNKSLKLLTGPNRDHTPEMKGHGFYMITESAGRSENETARLVSPIYASGSDICFKFWYHMFGNTIGELRVYLKLINSTDWSFKPEMALFRKIGNQKNIWRQGSIQFDKIENSFQIVIEGVCGGNFMGDIAIDDVLLIYNCTPNELTTLPTKLSFSTTTSELLYTIKSCEGICGETVLVNSTDNKMLLNCDCDEECIDRESCCPDFIDVCSPLLDLSTTQEAKLEFVTTEIDSFPTTQNRIPTTTTINKINNNLDYVTIPYHINDNGEDDDEEKVFFQNKHNQNMFKNKQVIDQSMIENQIMEEEPQISIAIYCTCIIFAIIFVIIPIFLLIRKTPGCRRWNYLRRASGYGDSQSDVRFIVTSDENLDLNLQRADDDDDDDDNNL